MCYQTRMRRHCKYRHGGVCLIIQYANIKRSTLPTGNRMNRANRALLFLTGSQYVVFYCLRIRLLILWVVEPVQVSEGPTFPILTSSECSKVVASCSQVGAMALQWPHHGAKNLTKWAPEARGEKTDQGKEAADIQQENIKNSVK